MSALNLCPYTLEELEKLQEEATTPFDKLAFKQMIDTCYGNSSASRVSENAQTERQESK